MPTTTSDVRSAITPEKQDNRQGTQRNQQRVHARLGGRGRHTPAIPQPAAAAYPRTEGGADVRVSSRHTTAPGAAYQRVGQRNCDDAGEDGQQPDRELARSSARHPDMERGVMQGGIQFESGRLDELLGQITAAEHGRVALVIPQALVVQAGDPDGKCQPNGHEPGPASAFAEPCPHFQFTGSFCHSSSYFSATRSSARSNCCSHFKHLALPFPASINNPPSPVGHAITTGLFQVVKSQVG